GAVAVDWALEIGRRVEVMVRVDQFRRALAERCRRRQHRRGADRTEPGEKLPPRRVAGFANWAIVESHGRSSRILLRCGALRTRRNGRSGWRGPVLRFLPGAYSARNSTREL